jgi:peptide-methionine (S)-S-oxide reductase
LERALITFTLKDMTIERILYQNKIPVYIIAITILLTLFVSCKSKDKTNMTNTDHLEKATLGAGCFWCVEAIFQDLKGVNSVISGYAGGHVENPSYKEVCTGETGHAEVAQITFDPNIISYEDLLHVFWTTHDPTTLNRQGGDVGTQYRSVIFYHSDEQKKIAEASKKEVGQSGLYPDPVVTEIEALTNFYEAEDYHQNYFNENPDAAYCQLVINPKVLKFRQKYSDKLKK